MTKINPNVEIRYTDFGFILLIPGKENDYHYELFGMIGIGHYELFEWCVCSYDDEFEDMLSASLEEYEDDVRTYRKTKKALA